MPAKPSRNIIKDYFYFTRGQRVAVVVLATAIALLIGVRYYLQQQSTALANPANDVVVTTLDSWEAYDPDSSRNNDIAEKTKALWQIPKDETTNNRRWQLEPFDPNTVSAEALLAMGFRAKSVQTIMNYRNKGGRFRQPEDIMKMYGLFPDEKERILPFVVIAPAAAQQANTNTPYAPAKKKAPVTVAINTADTAQWKALPGIGEKLSARIVKFREALGGFISVEQVGETFALPDSTFQKIKPMLVVDQTPVVKLNINTSTAEMLSKHPYINFKQAKFIVSYRQQHGNYSDAEILLQTPELFSADWWAKTRYYLEW